tara:strand:+ start:2443 stop:3690 length:1248 start_codon:yes stop_codon:yes gene_type:complete
MRTNFNVLKHQKLFIQNEAKYSSLITGYGGGKTLGFCLKGLAQAGKNVGGTILLAEPVFPMVRDVLQPTFEKCLNDLKFDYTYKASDMRYVVKWRGGYCNFILRSAENWRRWAGLNLASGGIDEAGLLKDDSAWRMLISRLREGKDLKAWTSTTPEGFNWVYEYWGEGLTDEYALIQGRTEDNPFLPEEFVESLKANYDKRLIEAYLHGKFVNLQHGSTYYGFSREKNVTDRAVHNQSQPLLVSLDFNIDPFCGIVWNYYPNSQKEKIVVFDEIQLRHGGGNELMTQAFINELKRRYPNHNNMVFYPDPSGKQRRTSAINTDHDIIRLNGIKLKAKRSAPSVVDRVNAVNKSFEHMIINPKCKGLIRDFEQVVNKEGTRDIDKSNMNLTHFSDGYGYGIDYELPIRKPTTKTFMG